MIIDKSVTTPISVDELLRNSLDCHAVFQTARNDTVFKILKFIDYIFSGNLKIRFICTACK